MKKVLILSVTAGDGHNTIGKAIEQGLKASSNDVKFVDIYKDLNCTKSYRIIDKGYAFLCQHMVNTYNFFYKKLLKRNNGKLSKYSINKATNHITPLLYKLILEYKPTDIVCTHVYAAVAVSKLSGSLSFPCVTYGILTDYSLHPYWEHATNINYLLLPSVDSRAHAKLAGFTSEQIITTGIPVHSKFLDPSQKTQARLELGLEPNIFTVLIVFGKACFKNIKEMIRSIIAINHPFQLIIINGKNKKYKSDIDKLLTKTTSRNVVNLGYVTNIEKHYSASDILISKAGATTINEALNKNLPLFVYCKLAYQEQENVRYLVKNNASVKIKNLKHLCEIIEKCITDPNFYNHLLDNINKIKNNKACENIVTLINQNSNNTTTYEADYNDEPLKTKLITTKNQHKHNKKNLEQV